MFKKMIKNYFKSNFFHVNILILFVLLSFQKNEAQKLFVDSGGEFYLQKDMDFTTSDKEVVVDLLGEFSVEAGNNWGSEMEYVDGFVTAIGSGETKLPTGNVGVYAPVFAKHTGNIKGFYSNSAPPSGSNGTNVDAVADVEYWKLEGNAEITLPWNDNSGIESLVNNNGGNLSSVAIVGLDNGTWDLISNPSTNTVNGDAQNGDVTSDANNSVDLNGFTHFTFGIDHQVVLSIEDQEMTNGIKMVSNPIKSTDEQIQFITKNNMKDLQITLYDINGRLIKVFKNIKTSGKIGAINKPSLRSGIYLLKFEHEGKQGIKKIIIE